MGYIGRGPVKSGAFRILDDISSSFNGSTTGFTLHHQVLHPRMTHLKLAQK